MLTQTELSNIEQGVYFQKLNCIGKGVGGRVYAINKNYVVKKVPNIGISMENKSFNQELETTILLSHHNIAPRVVYHSKNTESYTYYVMERLSYTLMYMIKQQLFTEQHLIKLVFVLKRLNKTQYRHGDLHMNNIMWSEKHNDFRLIDWGIFYITKKTRKKQSPYLINELLNYAKKYYKYNNLCIFTYIKFGKIKSEYKNADRTKRPHYKVECDISKECPITGTRYHRIGKNYDLNETEFNRLPEKDKLMYEVIIYPGADATRYQITSNHN
jgi:tRNA A-37 threonylcarbamoyl transferase component Bud32